MQGNEVRENNDSVSRNCDGREIPKYRLGIGDGDLDGLLDGTWNKL